MKVKHATLADFLEASGLTQAEFAEQVGVTQAQISRIANGERTPSLALAIRIAEAASVPVASLAPSSEAA